MTNEDILSKAITKAHKNRPDLISEGCIDCPIDNNEYRKIIFSHEFAQAFWQIDIKESFIESEIKELVVYEKQKLSWDHHLQQIVLEEEPLKYLERFL
ncbi:MAG: hypothetical protein ACPGVD_09025 [Flavobacteriales bacterium]